MSKTTMKAVIFKGPMEVAVEERPIPKIQVPTDIIVKVGYTALCGRYVEFFIWAQHAIPLKINPQSVEKDMTFSMTRLKAERKKRA